MTGFAQYTFGYGAPNGGWTPLVGDWNGQGTSGVGLYDPHASTFYLTSSLATGYAQYTFNFGVPNAGSAAFRRESRRYHGGARALGVPTHRVAPAPRASLTFHAPPGSNR